MSMIPGKTGNVCEGMRPRRFLFVRLAMLCVVAQANLGCTRSYYRDYADSDSYGILKERLFDWRWRVPERPVEADPRSRMADHNDPNHVPILPDDVAARPFQVSSRFPFEFAGWKKRGTSPIEDLSWQPYIPTESDGKVLLSKDSIMRLGMMNSRDYQTEYEGVYLAALSLTLARFQFMIQGYSNWGAFYTPLAGGAVPSTTTTSSTGSSTSTSGTTSGSSTSGTTGGTTAVASTSTPSAASLNNQLQLTALNGFTLNLMAGGQLLVNLANSLVFEYSNHNMQVVSPNLTVSFMQPLLRGAWWRVVTQSLSLQERQVLYTLRSFAEFRRQFYVALVTGGGVGTINTGYLQLLNQLQQVRNTESNLKSTKLNLDQYEQEVAAGFRSQLEVDQLALTYQQNQTLLLSSQAGLQSTLDAFKVALGLPTELEIRLDDTVLDQFELNDERLTTIRTRIDALLLKLLQNEVVPKAELADAARQLQSTLADLEQIHDQVMGELGKWREKLAETEKAGFSGPDATHNKEMFGREDALSRKIQTALTETDHNIDDNQDKLASFLAKLDATPAEEASTTLRSLVSKELRSRLSEVFVAQTQTRVFLISFKPVDLTVNQAIQVALGNRLDLQNALAQVTDAWRNVEVDANALRGFLNFVYNGSFNEAPGHAGLFRFDANSSIQTFGLQFDAPINRRAERNQYRADQIQYQRNRRAYMLARDTVVQNIRLDMRQLVLARRTFEINREQIITASRQLEQAEYDVRLPPDATTPVTLNLLTALAGVLTARNALISTWVSYETSRLSLYRDFDLMDIDSNGVWTNENDPTAINIALRNAESAPALSLGIPARIPDMRPDTGSDSTFYIDVEPGGKPNQVPDAATDRYDNAQPLGPADLRGGPAVPPRPGAVPPPPGAGPFAPPRPGP
jgi:outer membrane protein TolC